MLLVKKLLVGIYRLGQEKSAYCDEIYPVSLQWK